MIDEHDLRRRLHDAAGTIDAPPDLHARSERRAGERRRRRELGRRVGSVGAVALVVLAVGLVTATRSDAPDRVDIATPRTDRVGWLPVAHAPIGPRFQHASVAMGDDAVLVVGGYDGDGGTAGGAAVYEPSSGTWSRVDDPPFDLAGGPATWTGAVALVLATDGRLAAFDPASGSWDERERSPFSGVSNAVTSTVWAGDLLLVVNGADDRAAAAAYDPGADSWSDLPAPPAVFAFFDTVWTGRDLVVVADTGGSGKSFPHLVLLALEPGAGGWRTLPEPPLTDAGRRSHGFATWTGIELVVGGGATWTAEAEVVVSRLVQENRSATAEERRITEPRPMADAAAWNPATETWRPLPDAPVPVSGLDRYAEVWTGRHAVAWDAAGSPVLLDPVAGTWSLGEPLPERRHQEAPVAWTGHELFVWSGEPEAGDRSAMECCTPTASGYTLRL